MDDCRQTFRDETDEAPGTELPGLVNGANDSASNGASLQSHGVEAVPRLQRPNQASRGRRLLILYAGFLLIVGESVGVLVLSMFYNASWVHVVVLALILYLPAYSMRVFYDDAYCYGCGRGCQEGHGRS